ncbi:MAG TPA: hypothetical protein VI319_07220 [Burkholderiales bacterium]
MWTKHLFVTAAALAVLAPAGFAQAQSSIDVRQEDRRVDRQDDRRMDRRNDATESEVENENQNERAEVKLAVPRTATGAVDVDKLLALVRDQIAAGAREIQFRGVTLTAADVQGLLLSTAASDNLLAEIAALLPKDGLERKVTLRGAVDVRVTRQPDGTLRARIEDVNLAGLTPEQRAQLAQQLAALGFTRVEIRGVDSAGKRVRVEFRAARGVRNDDRGTSSDNRGRRDDRVADARGDRRAADDRPQRAERPERAERAERPERVERVEQVERVDRPDRSGRH